MFEPTQSFKRDPTPSWGRLSVATVRDVPALGRWRAEWAGFAVRVLVLIGYPAVGVFVTFAGLGEASQTLTVPYRVGVLCLAMIVIGAAVTRGLLGRIDGLLVLFWLIYAIRLFYDWQFADIPGADDSLLFFLMVVVVPSIAGILVGTELFADALFAKSVMIVGMFVLVACVAGYAFGYGFNPWADLGEETKRLGFEALNPISVGNAAAIVIICAFFLLMETRLSIVYKSAAWVAMGLGGYLIAVANSRGPIIACGLALVWFLLARIKRAAYVLPLFLALPFFISADNALIANLLERFTLNYEEDGSSMSRLLSQQAAIEAFLEHPLFGAFYVDPTLGQGFHPHNIVIETAMALGIFGLLLMLAMLIRAATKVLIFFNAAHPLLVMLLIQQFVLANTSGALYACDAFFMLLGMTFGAVPPVKQRHLRFMTQSPG
jgi:O-antigen ligase